jgi:predicted enzyme related to lactoylglutathione lyase
MTYTEWQIGEASVAGAMVMPPMVPAEVPAYWLIYFAVEDTDAAVAKATELGGSAMMPGMDTPAGRIAVLQDPQGAVFAVITMQAHEPV